MTLLIDFCFKPLAAWHFDNFLTKKMASSFSSNVVIFRTQMAVKASRFHGYKQAARLMMDFDVDKLKDAIQTRANVLILKVLYSSLS